MSELEASHCTAPAAADCLILYSTKIALIQKYNIKILSRKKQRCGKLCLNPNTMK